MADLPYFGQTRKELQGFPGVEQTVATFVVPPWRKEDISYMLNRERASLEYHFPKNGGFDLRVARTTETGVGIFAVITATYRKV